MENSKNNQHSATLDEVRDDVHRLEGTMDEVKGDVHELRGMMEDVLSSVNEFADKTERRFDFVEGEIKEIRAMMVTKDYLDEKMIDSRGDSVVLIKKEDAKLLTLVGVLEEKKVPDRKDVRKIYALEPFAQ